MRGVNPLVDVYPVGVLSGVLMVGRAVRSGRWDLTRWALLHLFDELRYLRIMARERKWRAARNAFNGWLAEHSDGQSSAGRGWTKRAARRRLRHLRARRGLST